MSSNQVNTNTNEECPPLPEEIRNLYKEYSIYCAERRSKSCIPPESYEFFVERRQLAKSIEVHVGAPDILKSYNRLNELFNKQTQEVIELKLKLGDEGRVEEILYEEINKNEKLKNENISLLSVLNRENEKNKVLELDSMKLKIIHSKQLEELDDLYTYKARINLLIMNSTRLQNLKKEYLKTHWIGGDDE